MAVAATGKTTYVVPKTRSPIISDSLVRERESRPFAIGMTDAIGVLEVSTKHELLDHIGLAVALNQDLLPERFVKPRIQAISINEAKDLVGAINAAKAEHEKLGIALDSILSGVPSVGTTKNDATRDAIFKQDGILDALKTVFKYHPVDQELAKAIREAESSQTSLAGASPPAAGSNEEKAFHALVDALSERSGIFSNTGDLGVYRDSIHESYGEIYKPNGISTLDFSGATPPDINTVKAFFVGEDGEMLLRALLVAPGIPSERKALVLEPEALEQHAITGAPQATPPVTLKKGTAADLHAEIKSALGKDATVINSQGQIDYDGLAAAVGEANDKPKKDALKAVLKDYLPDTVFNSLVDSNGELKSSDQIKVLKPAVPDGSGNGDKNKVTVPWYGSIPVAIGTVASLIAAIYAIVSGNNNSKKQADASQQMTQQVAQALQLIIAKLEQTNAQTAAEFKKLLKAFGILIDGVTSTAALSPATTSKSYASDKKVMRDDGGTTNDMGAAQTQDQGSVATAPPPEVSPPTTQNNGKEKGGIENGDQAIKAAQAAVARIKEQQRNQMMTKDSNITPPQSASVSTQPPVASNNNTLPPNFIPLQPGQNPLNIPPGYTLVPVSTAINGQGLQANANQQANSGQPQVFNGYSSYPDGLKQQIFRLG